MPRGSKTKYTAKQKRQAHHIEESEKKRGRGSQRAAQIAYATVNKQDGGGKKAGGSGRGRKRSSGSARPGSTATKARRRRTRKST